MNANTDTNSNDDSSTNTQSTSDPDFSALDAYLDEIDADGYLVNADGSSSTQRYLSGFDAPDPFITVYTPDTTALLVSALEYGRAQTESRADDVSRLADYDYRSIASEYDATTAKARVTAEWLQEHDVKSVVTPERFPIGPADNLREHDLSVSAESDDVVTTIRAQKTKTEIEHIRDAQTANEAAMETAATLIDSATVDDEILYYDNEILSSERIKQAIETTLLRHECALDETIVACGSDAADPHNRGHGPLHVDEPIVVDIFPRSKETHYHADMTRTFLKGTPDETLSNWFELTQDALTTAIDAIEPGVTGKSIHNTVCDIYEDAGISTLRSDPTAETGFIHSTGHGVGLDVHELPRVSPDGGELKPGHVITVEPGIYDPAVGGLRIEDLVVVTESGAENLTTYPITPLGAQ
ncbi:Xaa-Pro peptidase family protein [Haloquadratum walsbyi]|jgi:Xaa-Pro aminopeptidase|uniref:Xaa-pro aminopeptidase n=1 Tax=Haloquadratum walsbyi J07HQW2 TaxID=1238425 RepID=U1MYJ4_9EURY|nr:Xaa-Pro peptidase family protein [Haloquadratum walsbyi]ERG95564.1 MAG: Xaa-pro aminopeptidase [Haloquadratum walsbyi J07HQW2]